MMFFDVLMFSMIFEMPYAQQAYGISLKCRMLVSAMPSA